MHYYDNHYDRGLGWYRSWFPTFTEKWKREQQTGARVLTGEASPYYFNHPETPARLTADLPAAKLILLLRDPVERLLSHYFFYVREGYEPLPLRTALEAEEDRLAGRGGLPERFRKHARQHYSYRARGHYAEALERWLDHCAPENLLVLQSESFFDQPAACFQRVCRFLGVAEIELGSYRQTNEARRDGVDEQLIEDLRHYYRPHNERLYHLLASIGQPLAEAWEARAVRLVGVPAVHMRGNR